MLLLVGFKAFRQFVSNLPFLGLVTEIKTSEREKLVPLAKSTVRMSKSTRTNQQKKNYNLAWIQNNASLLFNCYSKTTEECNIDVFFSFIHCAQQRTANCFRCFSCSEFVIEKYIPYRFWHSFCHCYF